MHGCDSDIKYLVADLGIVTFNLFDTARAFSFIQRMPPFENIKNEIINISKHVNMLSLEKLMKMFIDLDLDKYYQVADWRIRPLPSDMLDYARNDSPYLIPLYLIFIKLLNPFAFSL